MENKSVNFPEIDLNNFPCIVKVENGDSILESNWCFFLPYATRLLLKWAQAFIVGQPLGW